MGMLRKNYTVQFKEEAVQLANKVGTSKAAKDLGVNPSNIRRWQDDLKTGNSTDTKSPSQDDIAIKENRRLKKENRYLLEVNEILKKSLGIFAKDKSGLP